MSRALEIRTGSRLHFGLFSFGDPACPHQFGGAGVMLRSPGLHLGVSPADRFTAGGAHSGRVTQFATRITEYYGWPELPACRVTVHAAPRQHVGLGTGTQLGLAVARLLTQWQGLHAVPAGQLAQASGRGLRSAVGAHGFEHGGLIIDYGHNQPGEIGKLEARCTAPSVWRFVLVMDPHSEGLAEEKEKLAFEKLPPVPRSVTQRLRNLALEEMLPAAQQADFNRFSQAVYEYGVLAGNCFASIQGGPFASPAIARRVELIQSLGYAGCGQSSWGPTVFAVTRSEGEAEELVSLLRNAVEANGASLVIAEGADSGTTRSD